MGGQPGVEDPIQFGRVYASKDLVEDQVAGDTADFGRSARARQSEAPALDLAEALSKAMNLGDLSATGQQSHGEETQD